VDVATIRMQIEDGIADELTRAVIGDVPAATSLVDLNPNLGEPRLVGQDVRAPSVAFDAECNHSRMLQEQQEIRYAAGSTFFDELALHRERVPVPNHA
jgi:hypothetical protein